MLTRPFTQLARSHRGETAVFAILAGAALLCFLLALMPLALCPPKEATLAQSALPSPPQPQVSNYSPHWKANLRTAYHAALYLLDPRV
jgi:hypothetical protein